MKGFYLSEKKNNKILFNVQHIVCMLHYFRDLIYYEKKISYIVLCIFN